MQNVTLTIIKEMQIDKETILLPHKNTTFFFFNYNFQHWQRQGENKHSHMLLMKI